ncbi:MAG: class I SAM-dependent methyltransferase [Porticoccaceae bacterium]
MARSSPFTLLLSALQEGDGLLVADENLGDADFAALPKTTVAVSNRFDIARAAEQAGLATHFSDFDFKDFAPASFQRIGYRIAKEKPVAHHVINQARALLAVGGELLLTGGQQEGIRTYADKAGAYFGSGATVEKHGAWYLARIVTNMVKAAGAAAAPLDDSDYATLRPIARSGDKFIHSKPGLFGWDKIDQGSALLAEAMVDCFAAAPPRHLLDLGCGYGYLGLVAAAQGARAIIATDNCAAALLACRRNFADFGVVGEVVAADCAAAIGECFDTIVCNPPFHRGFANDSQLTARFLAAAASHLEVTGRALFVVNRSVPLEKLAAEASLQTEKVREENGFRVFLLRHDKPQRARTTARRPR